VLKQMTSPLNSDNYACVWCILLSILQQQALTESKDEGSPADIHLPAVIPQNISGLILVLI